MDAPDATPTRHQRATIREVPRSVGSNAETILHLKGERASEAGVWTFNCRCRLHLTPRILVLPGRKEASKSVGSNGETVLRLKAAQAFGVGVWTFETSMSATLTPRILMLPTKAPRRPRGMSNAIAASGGGAMRHPVPLGPGRWYRRTNSPPASAIQPGPVSSSPWATTKERPSGRSTSVTARSGPGPRRASVSSRIRLTAARRYPAQSRGVGTAEVVPVSRSKMCAMQGVVMWLSR